MSATAHVRLAPVHHPATESRSVVVPATAAQLRFALGRRVTRTVRSGGVCTPDGQYASGKLVPLRGRKVEVLHIDGDTTAVEVFFEGRHICTAENVKHLSEQTAADFYAARATQRREVRKAKRDHLRSDEDPCMKTAPASPKKRSGQEVPAPQRGQRRDPEAVRRLLAKASREPSGDVDRPYGFSEEAA